jgi:ribose-phosphate pyrophosphokinase
MNPLLLSGSAHDALAREVAGSLGLPLCRLGMQRFLDGELHVEVQESVRGRDVYLIQPISPPADGHLMELLLLADACRRAGAGRLTAVVPYFGYARQDRRASGREPVSARLVADLVQASGIQHVVAVDLHTAAIEGFFAVPIEHLTAVPVLVAALGPVAERAVIVAPDLGAVKLAERYAALLQRPVAIVQKTRLSGEEVRAGSVVGEVQGRSPVIVDDMITTGGTVHAAAKALLAAGCLPSMTVVASHALLVGPALQRLGSLPIAQFVVTDSVVPSTGLPIETRIARLGPLLADAIQRLHAERSLESLLVHV